MAKPPQPIDSYLSDGVISFLIFPFYPRSNIWARLDRLEYLASSYSRLSSIKGPLESLQWRVSQDRYFLKMICNTPAAMIKLKEGIWTVKRRGPSSEICHLTRWNINWSRKVKVKVRKTKLFLNQSAIKLFIEIPLDRLIDNSRYLPTIINRQTGSRSWIVNKCPCCRYLWLKYLFVFLFIAKDLLHMFGVLAMAFSTSIQDLKPVTKIQLLWCHHFLVLCFQFSSWQ